MAVREMDGHQNEHTIDLAKPVAGVLGNHNEIPLGYLARSAAFYSGSVEIVAITGLTDEFPAGNQGGRAVDHVKHLGLFLVNRGGTYGSTIFEVRADWRERQDRLGHGGLIFF